MANKDALVVTRRTELAEALEEPLALIDSALSATKLTERPLLAAQSVVDHFVKAVRVGETEERLEHYLGKSWFAEIFAIVQKWYERKYGEALKRDDELLGVIEIHGLPFLVAVPATHSELEEPGQTAWLCFSVDLDDSEDPFRWIVRPPNIDGMTSGQRSRLRKRLATLTSLLRTINLNLMMAKAGSSQFNGLRNVAAMSVRKVARHLAASNAIEAGSAVWEMHYALEATLKAVVSKYGGAPAAHHILNDLLDDARAYAPLAEVPRNPFAFLPSAKLAIQHRYGETFSMANAMAIYERFLRLMVSVSAPIRGELDLSKARLLLAPAPWLRVLLEKDSKRETQPILAGDSLDDQRGEARTPIEKPLTQSRGTSAAKRGKPTKRRSTKQAKDRR